MKKNFISTTELAKLLGISRIAVYKKIKRGTIKAVKVGRNFVLEKKDLYGILGKELTGEQKSEVDRAVRKIVKEYGETLRMLGET
ncbi:MAG: hypothetical protein COT37_00370 [Parcubacteria group bacterium CG08_land_8_20_14_0_20_43_9]|nr:MAG: hypothetical protein COT37_00370 [Parcubacteria group bacterium CG08_land_8_20_14_0_20_43_9]